MARELKATRYLTKENEPLSEAILTQLPYMDFYQTLRFYAAIDAGLDDKGRALLNANDRYYLLTVTCHRKDAWHPWIFDRCREVERSPDGHLDLWARYHYKAVDVKEPVPTPDGWRKHGDLKPGDRVFGRDGRPRNVVARTPVFEDADCWRVTTDKGYSIVVSGDHLWTVDLHSRVRDGASREGRRTTTINTRDLATEVALSSATKSRVLPSLPLCDPVRYEPSADLPLAPYVLGLWLGDGNSADGRITGHPDDDEVFGRIAHLGYKVGKRKGFTRQVYGIRPILRAMGVSPHKHVPLAYLYGAVPDRWELLRGLMDSDGHCDVRGTATFTTTLEILAANVFELAASLGLKPSHRPLPTGAYQVSFQAASDRPPVFRLARKASRATSASPGRSRRHAIVSVEEVPSRPVSCIQIDDPDGVYLIGTQFVPTHNSTICTFGGCLQEIIIDPEITIAIMAGTNKIALPFLIQLQEEMESNQDLKRIHPDVFWDEPRKQAPQWSREKGITVRRKSNPKEATVEAFGLIDGMRTGKHYKLLNYDDLIDETMVDNPDIIRKVTQRWELSDNLGQLSGTRKWHQGTRYSFADTYGILIERKTLKERRHAATEDGTLKGKPVLLTQKRWEEVKTAQRSTINAQMLLNPLAGNESTFQTAALKHYDIIPAILNVYILVDPSKGKTKRSDRTAIAVIGIDVAGNKYLLDGYCHRMKLSRRYELITQLKEKWENHPGVQILRVGYEQYGMQSDLETIEENQLRDENYFEIVELNTPQQGKHSKNDRIERLEPDIRAGRFYLPHVVYHPEYGGGISNQALWEVWTKEDYDRMQEAGAKDNPEVGKILYRPMKDLTKIQRAMELTSQSYRIVTAIKRRNEDGDIYDLTRELIEELRFHPFAPHDDLSDAASRIYDIEPASPVAFEGLATEGRTFPDS